MPLNIIEGDITTLAVDAIVNAADPTLSGGGGVDGAIHAAAGPRLKRACRALGGCPVGEAKLTPGFRLPARAIIHTVGPIWQGGGRGEALLLARAYRSSLELAAGQGFESVAFPLISSGVYGYPKEEALAIAIRTITEFLDSHDLAVTLVIYEKSSFILPAALKASVDAFLQERLPAERPKFAMASAVNALGAAPAKARGAKLFTEGRNAMAATESPRPLMADALCEEAVCESIKDDLRQRLETLDESFSEMLLRKIDERGMTDAACYKKANIDRKLFSKIRGDVHYKPSKVTAVAFAIALELSKEETAELLQKAGYALSPSSKFDIIIDYFISHGRYDVFEINEVLFAYDQPLLCA